MRKAITICLLVVMTAGFIASCSTNQHYNPARTHHTKSGFKNVYYQDEKGFWDFIKWKWEQLSRDIPDAETYHFETETTHHEFLKTNTDKAVLPTPTSSPINILTVSCLKAIMRGTI